MKLKVISGMMLTLFLVSMLSTVVSVSAGAGWIPADIVEDGEIDILDVAAAAKAFGSKSGDPNWNASADLVADNLIDIFDLVSVAIHYGEVQPP